MQYPINHLFYEKEQGLYYRVCDYDPILKTYSCEIILDWKIKFTSHEVESRLISVEKIQ